MTLEGRGSVSIRADVETVDHDQDPGFAGETDAATQFVVIEITDSGPGVPAALSDRIFDPFFTTKPQGSGLGLPIVRKIVDAHDGRIDLTSTPGLGTRFRVMLPVSNAPAWFK